MCAARTATKSGNWSDVSVWDGGASSPGAGDTANSNGFTVTIDQDITVTSLLNTNSVGGFAISAAHTINAAIPGGSYTVLTCSQASGTVTFNGAITGGNGANRSGLVHSGAGTTTITGAITGGTAAANAFGVLNSSAAGTVNIVGDVTSGAAGVGAAVSSSGTTNIQGVVTNNGTFGADNTSTGTIAVTGNTVGGSATNAHGIRNNSTGTVTISGTSTGGSGATSFGVINQSTGTVTVGTAVASAASAGLSGVNSGGTTTFKIAQSNANGMIPVVGFCKMVTDSDVNYFRVADSVSGTVDLSNDYPTEGNVVDDVVYKLGTLTGTYVGGGSGGMLKGEKRGGKQ